MTRKIPKKIDAINSIWVQSAPFFSEFLLNFSYIEEKTIPTMGVGLKERFFTIYYNPDFVENLPSVELQSVLVHEIMHILSFTKARATGKEHYVFNVASDIAINEEINNDFTINNVKLKLDEKYCLFKQIQKEGYDGLCVAEPIYEFLMKEKEKNKDKYDFSNMTVDDHSKLEEMGKSIVGDIVVQEKLKAMIDNAKARGYGNISSNMQLLIETLIKADPVPLEKIFRNKVQQYISGKVFKKNSWKKLNRRDFPLKGRYKIGTKINIAVDTSGSVWSSEIFGRFFYSINEISKKFNVNTIEFDTEVKKVSKYKVNQKFSVSGSGGTDPSPVFKHLKDKKEHNIPLIIFTDGEFNYNMDYCGIHPMWVIIQNNEYTIKYGELK